LRSKKKATSKISVLWTFPPEFRSEVATLAAHYPELWSYAVHFKWGHIAQKSFMLAQPVVPTLLWFRSNRVYQIIIKKRFFVKNELFNNGRISSEVIVGWLGHELGHVLDYKDRSSLSLLWFGIKYHFSKRFIKHAEETADYNAVQHGLIVPLLVSKEFGRNPDFFPPDYISKLNDLYPSLAKVISWNEAREERPKAI
jgi:hypothetical protein